MPHTDPFQTTMDYACDQARPLMLTVVAQASAPGRPTPPESRYLQACAPALHAGARHTLRLLGPRLGAEYRRALLLRHDAEGRIRDEIEPGRIATLIEAVCAEQLAALQAQAAQQALWTGRVPDLLTAEDFAFTLHEAFVAACPDPALHRTLMQACAVALARQLRDLLQDCVDRLEPLLRQESQVVHLDGEEADRLLRLFAATDPETMSAGETQATGEALPAPSPLRRAA